ncbi:MAG: MerR family transcriptional regulator [Nitriliruptorales bacterium]
MADLLTIGEVGDEVGVRTSTLRYYDELGLVEPTTRVSGERRYDPRAVRRLRVVGLCRQAGFTLAEIKRLLDGEGDWRPLAEAKLAELERRITELRHAKRLVQAALECDCDHLEGCARTAHGAPQEICGTGATTKEAT